MADDIWDRAVAGSGICCRWESGAFSLDRVVRVLSALSGCDRLGSDVFASLLAAAAPDGCATTKHLAHHTAGCSNAWVVVRQRDISCLVLIRCCTRPGGSLDDFSESLSAR